MLDFNPFLAFSQNHCIAICAVLVPANLLATLQTLIMVGVRRPSADITLITAVASLYALLMILHVGSWLASGVVMLPTFILAGLAGVCFVVNSWAIAYGK